MYIHDIIILQHVKINNDHMNYVYVIFLHPSYRQSF